MNEKRVLVGLAVALAVVAWAPGCGDPSIRSKDGLGAGGAAGSGDKGGSSESATPAGGAGSFTFNTPGGSGASTPSTMSGAMRPGGASERNCGFQTFTLEKVPPELLLVFDRSKSMTAAVPGTPNNRWVETTGAIDDILGKTSAAVSWGLKMFPTGNYCMVTTGVDVPIGPQSDAAIRSTLAKSPPGAPAGTPTNLAVDEAVAYLKTRTTPNPRYIVLATDGEPDCGANAEPSAVSAVGAARAAGFSTFVIGIATAGTTADGVLDRMAVSGGQPRSAAPRYYPVANRDDLAKTLGQITGRVGSCVFALDKQPPSPDDVAVKLDGEKVARDPASAEGWNYGPGMRSIQLFGAACERVKSGRTTDISIVFGCPNVAIP